MSVNAENVRYGGIGLLRGFCRSCGGASLIKNSEFVCCGRDATDIKIVRTVREGPGRMGRGQGGHTVSKKKKLEILRGQNWLCAYCLLPFMFTEIRDTKRRNYKILRICWDHFVPWAYEQSNKVTFLAACQLCNSLKSSFMFPTIEEARAYIRERWEARYQVCRILEGAPVSIAASAFSHNGKLKDFAERSADSNGTTKG